VGSEGILIAARYDGGRPLLSSQLRTSDDRTAERLNEKGTPESAKYEAHLNPIPETEIQSDEQALIKRFSLPSKFTGWNKGRRLS
jgi:hypothetical protein